MLGICQFKKFNYLILFFTLLVSGCAKKDVIVETIAPTGTWFSTHKKFRYTNFDGRPESHLFFDFTPVIDIEQKMLDVVLVTPESSKFHYELDLVSGKRYFSHEYCPQRDIWKSYEPTLSTPPYNLAVVPRLLNQVKKPQRVVVFGDKKYLSSSTYPQDEMIRVKVIGGMVEQFCNNFPCEENKRWESSLLLFAVSPLDPEFKDINTFAKLVKKIDWKEVKAFVENSRGSSRNGKNFYPAYRLIGQVFPTKAMKTALHKGHLFANKEIKTLRRSCENVYKRVYKIKSKVEKGEGKFSKLFYGFYKRYWKLFKTCREYVRPSSIVYNANDHWYMEYISSFIYAEKSGYVFDCSARAWARNLNDASGRPIYNQERELRYCTTPTLNLAFERAVNHMTGLSTSGQRFHRYIQYDSGAKSHGNKIYNWIQDNGKRLSCEKDRKVSVFPSDVNWKPIINPTEKDKDVSVYIR